MSHIFYARRSPGGGCVGCRSESFASIDTSPLYSLAAFPPVRSHSQPNGRLFGNLTVDSSLSLHHPVAESSAKFQRAVPQTPRAFRSIDQGPRDRGSSNNHLVPRRRCLPFHEIFRRFLEEMRVGGTASSTSST